MANKASCPRYSTFVSPARSADTPHPSASHNGALLESETYVGGHVECLQTGIYRNDLPVKFRLVPEAPQFLGLELGFGFG